MIDKPFIFNVPIPGFKPSRIDNHVTRHLSDLKGQFLDTDAYNQMIQKEDVLLYEVYEVKRPEVAGEMLTGIDIVHPGKVGDEFFMTKGHFHEEIDTAEIYYCLQGEGLMVMETPEGDWAVEKLVAGSVLYVPPRWAHRSVNIGSEEDLVMFFAYPGNAGHDYGTIETQGFRKLILDVDGKTEIVDNPRWSAPEGK